MLPMPAPQGPRRVGGAVVARRKSPRQKGPRSAEELAAHIKVAGGVHLHRVVTGWRLTLDETRMCFTDQCFVMRLKNVKEEKP